MSRVPKILHYCFGLSADFGGKPWSLIHHAGVASAIRHIQPDAVHFYYEHEPHGPWWELTRQIVTPIRIKAPTQIFGRPLLHPAHQADVVRLEKLIEMGGIYLDADVLVHRNFDNLLENSTVLGREGCGSISGMANAVILAEPHAQFLERWYKEYHWFRGNGRGEYWAEHSVQLPAQLAKDYPDEITVLPPTAFFWPLWTDPHISWIFNSTAPIPIDNSYANHLWESKAWHYVDHLTPGQVRTQDTNFHRWARPYVEGLPDELGRAPMALRLEKHAKRIARATKGHLSAAINHIRHGDTSASGNTANDYVRNISVILKQTEAKLCRPITVVEIGCADFSVGRALIEALPTLRYVGCDVTVPLIEYNMHKYSSDRVSFRHLNLAAARPPKGDVCLVRHVLQKLSNADIVNALHNLTGFEALYITEAQPEIRTGPPNPDKPPGQNARFDSQRGIGRGVELGIAPFCATTKEVFRSYAFPHEVVVTDSVMLS